MQTAHQAMTTAQRIRNDIERTSGWLNSVLPRTGRMTWEPGHFWPAFVADIRYWLDESNEDQA